MIFVIYQIFILLYFLLMMQILLQVKNIAKLCSETNRELNWLYNWLCLNKLSINIEKTNYTVFSTKYLNFVTSIGINNITRRIYDEFFSILYSAFFNEDYV